MKLNEFVNKWIGKKCDFDGAYGAQCVDLFRQYCKEVVGSPHTGAVEGAKDLWLKWKDLPVERKWFKRVRSPKTGDALIWNSTETNPYGHVAIMLSKLNEDYLVFEQNGFKQGGCIITIRSEKNLLGGLRPL